MACELELAFILFFSICWPDSRNPAVWVQSVKVQIILQLRANQGRLTWFANKLGTKVGLFFLSLEHWFSKSKAKQVRATNAIAENQNQAPPATTDELDLLSISSFQVINPFLIGNGLQIHFKFKFPVLSMPNLWRENTGFRQPSSSDGHTGCFKYPYGSQASH